MNKKYIAQSPFKKFSIKVLSNLLNCNQNKNFLVSPARIMSILAFLSNFTDDETKKHILNILEMNDDDDKLQILSRDFLLPSNNYESWTRDKERKLLKIENYSTVWIDSKLSTSDFFNTLSKEWNFIKIISSFFYDETKENITNIVKEHTNGMIKKINFDLSNCTKAILIDCLNFKGKWEKTFDTNDTKPDIFYSMNFKKIVPFMKVRLIHGNYYCQSFYAIELKYRCYCIDRSYSMRIYLPRGDKTCKDVLGIIQKRSSSIEFKTRPIILSLPKFKISIEENLSDVLKNMGLDIKQIAAYIFDEKSEYLMINDIVQQGSLKTTEKGTEVGISTYTSCIMGKSRVHFKELKVNRPFIFEIIEKYSGLRLFAGVVNKV